MAAMAQPKAMLMEEPVGERKMISSGSFTLEVEELDSAEVSIQQAIKDRQGYIASVDRYQDRLRIFAKIPAEHFADFMEAGSSYGATISKSSSIEDVSERFYDLERRIESKEILIDRFQNYLREAEKLEEILQVERELNNELRDLEQLKGRFRGLDKRISYADVSIELRLPSWEGEQGDSLSLRAGFHRFASLIVQLLFWSLFLLLGIFAIGVPLVLLLGFVYWISFGKIGLVRRFFRRLQP